MIPKTFHDIDRTEKAIQVVLDSLDLSNIRNTNYLFSLFSSFIENKLSAMQSGYILGRKSQYEGNIEELSTDDVKILLDIEVDPKIKFTAEGGLAIKLLNATGTSSIKGYCVTTGDVDNAVIKVPVDLPNCIGVFYESGYANNNYAWVVVGGIADVYFSNIPTRGYLARTGITTDTGEVSGQAISESIPTSPFATDKHFCEIGHILETKTTSGLAKVVLHFN